MDLASLRTYLLAKPGATEDYPFDPVTLVLKVGGKMFALVGLNDSPLRITLKCDPAHAEFLRHEHAAITPGYYMNKQHWNTIILDGSVPDTLLHQLIDESYQLVFQGLPRTARQQIGVTLYRVGALATGKADRAGYTGDDYYKYIPLHRLNAFD